MTDRLVDEEKRYKESVLEAIAKMSSAKKKEVRQHGAMYASGRDAHAYFSDLGLNPDNPSD